MADFGGVSACRLFRLDPESTAFILQSAENGGERLLLGDVRRLVDALPDNQREVLYMRYYQDLSFKEIAAITGVSINTALGRMRYAIINMRRMAEEKHIALEMY